MYHTVDLSVLNNCHRAHGAGYQHGDRKGCLRGTRETVLDGIESWIRDLKKSPVFWLNGLTGTGKSTIAQTVSERVFTDGLLGASFFCSHDFEDRSDLHLIFPTLAFQLAHKYSAFRSVLVPLLRSNPEVVHESLYRQMEKMIVEPLKLADVSTIVVIDALDECRDDEPSSAILSVLGRFVEQIPNVKFFITGRPEPQIKTGFRLPLLVDSTDVFVLHDVHPSLINNDIRLFLKHELSELAQRRQIRGWPSDEYVDILCDRAAGLFVYAVATVKFLDSRNRLPKQRLEVILNLPECTAPEGKTRFNSKTTLDSLYTSILKTAFEEEDGEVDSKVRSTIGTVVLLVNPLPPSGIAGLIGLDPEEVALFLESLQSLLTLGEDSSQPVKPFHKSFPDFITDPSRCTDTRFCISPKNLHLELAMNCLRVMNGGLKRNLLSLPDYALNSEVKDLQARIDDRIGDALRYACRSWHNHLTRTGGDVIDVMPHLRIFLEERFLAWLEVFSVLGAVREAVAALEQLIVWLQEVCLSPFITFLSLIGAINQVSRNEELLNTVRDYFYFVTRFFELISVSATHIYHTALELSPLSSIIRRLYYHWRHTPSPRVMVGNQDSWDPWLAASGEYDHSLCTWSPCGRFAAAWNGEGVEIRDPLSFELLSTLMPTEPTQEFVDELACSIDGCSVASIFGNSLTIWDIQTGGVAKETELRSAYNFSLVWSLNGSTIGIISADPGTELYRVYIYNIASGEIHSPGVLSSVDDPYLWAHDASFRVMTTARDDQGCGINIFEVGSVLTKIESFCIGLQGRDSWVGSFSQTTYRISISIGNSHFVFDVRTSRRLSIEGYFKSHCFSSDGNLFAGVSYSAVHVWKYTSDDYILWRQFPLQDLTLTYHSFQFSPTSSSLLARSEKFLHLLRLDGPPIVDRPGHWVLLVAISRCGSYVATGRQVDSSVTITNLLSQTPSHFIDTGMMIKILALTGNILLVSDSETIAAWRLTEEGAVDGVFVGGRVGRNSSIWTVSLSGDPTFSVEDQTVATKQGEVIHVYCTETGEVLGSVQTPPYHCHEYTFHEMLVGRHYLRYQNFNRFSWTTDVQGGWWVKDLEGKHRLWIPVEWRGSIDSVLSSDDGEALRFDSKGAGTVFIKF